jgi:hypothetical protein
MVFISQENHNILSPQDQWKENPGVGLSSEAAHYHPKPNHYENPFLREAESYLVL